MTYSELEVMRLDSSGRCCGRKPLYYKGGSWRSPTGSPMYFCGKCMREFGPDGEQRENFAWKKSGGGFITLTERRTIND